MFGKYFLPSNAVYREFKEITLQPPPTDFSSPLFQK